MVIILISICLIWLHFIHVGNWQLLILENAQKVYINNSGCSLHFVKLQLVLFTQLIKYEKYI